MLPIHTSLRNEQYNIIHNNYRTYLILLALNIIISLHVVIVCTLYIVLAYNAKIRRLIYLWKSKKSFFRLISIFESKLMLSALFDRSYFYIMMKISPRSFAAWVWIHQSRSNNMLTNNKSVRVFLLLSKMTTQSTPNTTKRDLDRNRNKPRAKTAPFPREIVLRCETKW